LYYHRNFGAAHILLENGIVSSLCDRTLPWFTTNSAYKLVTSIKIKVHLRRKVKTKIYYCLSILLAAEILGDGDMDKIEGT
jgi:hypothetical protein